MSEVHVKPTARNSIVDIAGLRVGNAEDRKVRTGVTVVLPDRPVVMGVDIRGGAPGTRDTDALDPSCLVEEFHGLTLAGGSVFGLAAADAVTEWLSAQGRGLALAGKAVPVAPAAILYDLANGGDKDWGERSPYYALGLAAAKAATDEDFARGRAGAGYGALAGDRAGGLGSACLLSECGFRVGALVAVNAFGPPLDDRCDRILMPKLGLVGTNTTIALVATDLALDKAGARRLAIMAHDGLARTLRPVHTPFDGDTVFAMATGDVPVPAPAPRSLLIAGTMAADALAAAVRDALARAATPV
ncbi:MAG: P1 family peptidase [Rhodothalassiaceae bacterium]